MANYLLKRILLMIPTFFGILVVSFFVIRLAPGDPRGSAIDAVVRDVADDGSLIVTHRGRDVTLFSGEVSLRGVKNA